MTRLQRVVIWLPAILLVALGMWIVLDQFFQALDGLMTSCPGLRMLPR